jgi:hypothetical protein
MKGGRRRHTCAEEGRFLQHLLVFWISHAKFDERSGFDGDNDDQ